MKSEGTCVCGGKITFKTSGQQVMITPPLSMREAGQVVYSNPLLKKEDIKTVQKKVLASKIEAKNAAEKNENEVKAKINVYENKI